VDIVQGMQQRAGFIEVLDGKTDEVVIIRIGNTVVEGRSLAVGEYVITRSGQGCLYCTMTQSRVRAAWYEGR